jgi:hypothetical protein
MPPPSSGMRLAAVCGVVAVSLLTGCGADNTDGVPPDPSPTGYDGRPVFEGSEREWIHANAACLQERGFDVSIEEQGVPPNLTWVPKNLPQEQVDAYNEAFAACLDEIGEPAPGPPATEADLREEYRLEVATAECLRKLGYEISDPPSEDVFVETFEDPAWLAYGELPADMPPGEWERVNEECPQPADQLRTSQPR